MNMHQPPSMYTYILRITNKEGFEWVDDNGETETIVAESLDKALDSLSSMVSLDQQIFNDLLRDRKFSFNYETVFPLNITATEIPFTGQELTQTFITETVNRKIDKIYEKVCRDVDEYQTEEQKKQVKIEKLKVEAKKLGLTLKDLKGNLNV